MNTWQKNGMSFNMYFGIVSEILICFPQIKYEYYNNCNLTEIGDPFAEQPYAVAVQQGSHLQEEISKVILELQKDR